jgi:hypothetical protein
MNKVLNFAAPAAVAAGLAIAGSKMNEIYSDKSAESIAHKMVLEDSMSRMMYDGYDPSAYIASHPEALTMAKALELAQTKIDIPKALEDELNSVPAIPQGGNPVLEGKARMVFNVLVGDERTRTSISMRQNTLPVQVNTGSVREAREAAL